MKRAALTVDKFTVADYLQVRKLWKASGLDFSPGDGLREIRSKLKRDPELFLVAHQGREVIGSAMGAWDGRRGWVYHLAVSPASRRAGVGSRLLAELESQMRRKGVLKVNAIVYDWNVPSLSLFEKCGFSRQSGQVVVGKYLRPHDSRARHESSDSLSPPSC